MSGFQCLSGNATPPGAASDEHWRDSHEPSNATQCTSDGGSGLPFGNFALASAALATGRGSKISSSALRLRTASIT